MKIIKINSIHPETVNIERVKGFLKDSCTVVYPTDTVYGIGANIYDEKAVLKVFSMKKRLKSKPLSICLSKIEDIKNVAYINNNHEEVIRKLLPGPFTIILEKKDVLSPLLTAGTDKIGIRIPNNKICMDLAEDFPITSTSANLSGHEVQDSPRGILKQLGSSIDILLDAGICENGFHSTVVDMTGEDLKIIRKGSGYNILSNII
jgi:L-threonylcarbamoyladenylate synthase